MKDNKEQEVFGLTTRQKEAFESIHWFCFGGRGTGRTYIMACVAIRRAMEFPGTKVYLGKLTHEGDLTINARQHLFYEVASIVKMRLPDLAEHFKYFRKDFSIMFTKA